MFTKPNSQVTFYILRRLVLEEQSNEWRMANPDIRRFITSIENDERLLELTGMYLVCESKHSEDYLNRVKNRLRDKFF